ncbi:MAG: 4-hydroxy-tetrahydrodipicolinate reductase [Flavobacteriales bacterium]|nr:4-hydroxy-tetrahydrodipicolinate reductase [Flavobacteriales bacterium]|tara:strand:+ start:1787 stop:2503 length:717 start_codon:yes stop_codon:yes gene_type:complete
MKIAIIGYGKMGKAIEAIALERGHEIPLKLGSENANDFDMDLLASCDVAIEFSRPESAAKNIEKCIQASVPVVVGTTGWYDQYDRLSKAVKDANTALLAATNFSVGVNLFFALNKKLAELMSDQSDYKASMTEIHHLQKLDSPSGTAITLAEGLIENHPEYSKWVNEASSQSEVLPIISEREAEVPGTHIVKYESEIDSIEITHLAKSRKGFALGAVIAAEFLKDKEGIYNMKDVLNI